MIIDDMEWMLSFSNRWIFGKKVRGVIRDELACVFWNGNGWCWAVHRANVDGEIMQVSGVSKEGFLATIDKAEAILQAN